jgi:serine/threonine protein kinase
MCETKIGVRIPPTVHACMLTDKQWGTSRSIPLAGDGTALRPLTKVGQLGEGTYGKVFKVMTPRGGIAAIKQASCGGDKEDYFLPTDILHEFEVRNFNDPGIVGICKAEFVIPPDYEVAMAITNSTPLPPAKFLMEMDMAATTLRGYINDSARERSANGQSGTLNPFELKMLVYQLVRAVAVMHGHLVCNYDIKPENTLIFAKEVPPHLKAHFDQDTAVRLCISDFGLSRAPYTLPESNEAQFTRWYRPPEVLLEHGVGTPFGDVWATACVIYFMATSTDLFVGDDEVEQIHAIVDLVGTSEFSDPSNATWFPAWNTIPPFIPSAAGLLQTLEHDLKHYSGLASLLVNMLQVVPVKRCSIFAALSNPYFDQPTVDLVHSVFPEMRVIPPRVKYMKNLGVAPSDGIRILLEREAASWTPDEHKIIEAGKLALVQKRYQKIAEATSVSVVKKFAAEGRLIESMALALLLKYMCRIPDSAPVIVDMMAACRIADKYCSSEAYYDDDETEGYPQISLLTAQCKLLKGLDFDITSPSAYHFLQAYWRIYAMEKKIPREVGSSSEKWKAVCQLLHMCQLDARLAFSYPRPSEVAAMCITYVVKEPIFFQVAPSVPFSLSAAHITAITAAIDRYLALKSTTLHHSSDNYSIWITAK